MFICLEGFSSQFMVLVMTQHTFGVAMEATLHQLQSSLASPITDAQVDISTTSDRYINEPPLTVTVEAPSSVNPVNSLTGVDEFQPDLIQEVCRSMQSKEYIAAEPMKSRSRSILMFMFPHHWADMLDIGTSYINEDSRRLSVVITDRIRYEISLPLTKINVVALCLLGCLCLLGTFYLWKICVKRKCKCRLCRGLYLVEEELGSGGYGVVYLVTRASDNSKFVMKQIPVSDITEADEVTMEAKQLLRLRHKYIVSYEDDFIHTQFGLSEADDMMYYFMVVMEYCPLGDLKIKVDTDYDNFSENLIREWFEEIVEAVAFLHSQNIIHRDLKSQNVFLCAEGTIRLGDFGLARWYRGKQELLQQTMTQAGTDCYMAPEMLAGKRYGKAADMWSLGCLLLELCSGTFMWEISGILGAQILISTQCVHDLVNDLPEGVGPGTKSMIKSLLKADPNERPTCQQLLHKRYFKSSFAVHADPFHKWYGEEGGGRPRADTEGSLVNLSKRSTVDILSMKPNGVRRMKGKKKHKK
eukprot:Platyproteum_vivax@DN6745_c0_g1_i1.p1